MTADASRRLVLRAAALTLLAAGVAGCTNGVLSAVSTASSSATTSTVEALPGILDDLQARGLQAVSASTLLAG